MKSPTRTLSLSVLCATLALLVFSSAARSEISKRDGEALAKSSLIYVATVRKDGNQSTAAPVWFTVGSDNNSILIQTGPRTWKAKRIKRGSPVLVWIGSASGPAFIGKAEITSDASIQSKILDDFRQKYIRNRLFGTGPSREKFDRGEVIAIRITPVRDLPDGFASAPATPPPPLDASAVAAPSVSH